MELRHAFSLEEEHWLIDKGDHDSDLSIYRPEMLRPRQ